MQRKASEQTGKLRICHVDLRLITVVSYLVPFPTKHSTRVFCVKLRYSTAFDVVDSVLLHLSHYVTVITAREVYKHKMAYHGDKLEQSL